MTAPSGWNKTIDDLMAEMKRGLRTSMSGEEIEWARAYERSLLTAGTRFPRQGDVYELLEDMEATFFTAWAAPSTGSGTGRLRKGERMVVKAGATQEEPIAVYAEALDYANLEKRLVAEDDRKHPRYVSFYFCFKTADLNRRFRLVSPT